MAQGSYLLIGVTIINILINVRMRERNIDLSKRKHVHKGLTVHCKDLMGHHDELSQWSHLKRVGDLDARVGGGD